MMPGHNKERGSCPRFACKIGVPKNFAKFTRFCHRYFSVNFSAKFTRAPFIIKHFGATASANKPYLFLSCHAVEGNTDI